MSRSALCSVWRRLGSEGCSKRARRLRSRALAGPVAGLALGVVTAFVVIFGRIPAIVATLGLLGVYRAGIFLALAVHRRAAASARAEAHQQEPHAATVARIGNRKRPIGKLLARCGPGQNLARLLLNTGPKR